MRLRSHRSSRFHGARRDTPAACWADCPEGTPRNGTPLPSSPPDVVSMQLGERLHRGERASRWKTLKDSWDHGELLRGLFLATWSVQRYHQAASPSFLEGRWHGVAMWMKPVRERPARLHCATWSPVRGFTTAYRILVSAVLGTSLGGCTACRHVRNTFRNHSAQGALLPIRQTHELCAQTLHVLKLVASRNRRR